MYTLKFTKQTKKDLINIKRAGLKEKLDELMDVLKVDPFQTPPQFEKLSGDLKGLYSRRINHQHRLVYSVDKENKTVRVVSMWTHYENL